MSSKGNLIAVAAMALLMAVPLAASQKGALDLSLRNPIYVGGNQINAGALRINWQSHSPEATVTFATNGKQVLRTSARFVDLETPATYSSIVTEKDAQGRDVLKEVRIAGKKSALVFD